MDRVTIYPGAIPLETDLLSTNKNVMIALSKLSAAMLGTGTIANGFAVTPTGPASLQVVAAPGEIYSLQNVDGTAYSSLAADTAHQIVKQGVVLDPTTLSCAAPTTSGQSINYLVEVAYQDLEAIPVVLPYYNATNPSQAYSGPGNNGVAQYTQRKGAALVQVKAGASATTGSQVTPAPDVGYVGLYVVTVAFGQTTITSGNISQAASAPLINTTLHGLAPAFTVPPVVPPATLGTHAMQLQQATGRLLRTSVYSIVGGVQMVSVNGGTPTATGATTFTALALATAARIKCQAAGGGSGGSAATGAGTLSVGGGGGGGAYAEGWFTSAFSGLAVTVGVGGTAGPAGSGAGGTGGSSSVGGIITSPGGNGSQSATTAAAQGGFFGGSGQSSAPTGGNLISVRGSGGLYGTQWAAISANAAGGYGGASVFGGGSIPASPSATAPGVAGVNFGSGAAGAQSNVSSSAQVGAKGADGIVIIEEYAV
jgi:hypothetical protein